MPYGRILKLFLKKLKTSTFWKISIFHAVDAPTASLRSPTAHDVEVWVSEYPYPDPPPRKRGGGFNYYYSRRVKLEMKNLCWKNVNSKDLSFTLQSTQKRRVKSLQNAMFRIIRRCFLRLSSFVRCQKKSSLEVFYSLNPSPHVFIPHNSIFP